VFPFPETVPNFVCHFKGSLHFFWLWWAEPVEALIMVPIIQKKESRDCRAKPAMNATRDNYFFGSSSDIVGASLVR
jgi:hypothetical protein